MKNENNYEKKNNDIANNQDPVTLKNEQVNNKDYTNEKKKKTKKQQIKNEKITIIGDSVLLGASAELKKINPDINVMTGSLATLNNNDTEINLRYDTFFNKIINQGTYKYTDTISYHPYDWNNISKQNEKIYDTIEKVNNIFNNAGGFIKQAVTEYGIASYNNNKVTEDIQASKLVQQTVITDFENADKAILYNFWNVGTDANNIEHNFGLLNNDGTPKKSYYAMKNYYENTNGAVYIGKVDIKE